MARQAHGLHPTWRRGYGRWVHGVLVWTKSPFFFGNELMPVNSWEAERTAETGDVKRLGDKGIKVRLRSG